MIKFKKIIEELQIYLKINSNTIKNTLRQNPALCYTMINKLCSDITKKYGIQILLNFPQKEKINDVDSYGTQNISVIINKKQKKFSTDINVIKLQAKQMFASSTIKEAYMYDGKEGLKIFFENGRIDILPHSFHLWCKLTCDVLTFSSWLLNSYKLDSGRY